jgi:hypothetical protein
MEQERKEKAGTRDYAVIVENMVAFDSLGIEEAFKQASHQAITATRFLKVRVVRLTEIAEIAVFERKRID